LINKIYCPRDVFPLSSILVAGVDAALSTTVLVALFFWFGVAPKLTSLWIPVLLAVQIAFTLGVILILSSVLVYLRDLRHALPLLLQFGLFASPVAYQIEIDGSLRFLFAALNPLAPVIDGYRLTVLSGEAPDLALLGVGALAAVNLLVAGYLLFKKLETGFADVA
jgi:ABC-2 type transport system permease protein/lipopolysaccharide transport system permease protein